MNCHILVIYCTKIKYMKCCKQCNETKALDSFRKINEKYYEGSCKQCAAKRTALYRINNPEKVKLSKKNSYLKKQDYYINKTKEYRNNTLNYYSKKYYQEKNDPFRHFKSLIRKRISAYLNKKSFSKTSKAEHILGCSYEEAMNYISNQFKKGMSWNNRSEWHIDHIIPLSSATTQEELIKLCHYTNLQPLWAKDNLQKSNKIINYEN